MKYMVFMFVFSFALGCGGKETPTQTSENTKLQKLPPEVELDPTEAAKMYKDKKRTR